MDVIESSELILHFNNITMSNVSDAKYMPLDYNWVLNVWGPRWKMFCSRMNYTYSHRFDCDNFASRFRTRLQDAFHVTPREQTGECDACAVGEVWYQIRNNGGGHAINIVACGDKKNRQFVFIEPQPAVFGVVEMTKEEFDSIWFARW